MKKLASILILGIVLLTCSFCGTSKNSIKKEQQTEHPFKVIDATYHTWAGGQPGVKGINITISIDNPEIQLDSVFFRNMKTGLKRELNSKPTKFVGVYTLPNTKHDYNLNKDSLKEYGNKVPDVSLNIPFELKKDEAVVRYLYKGNTHYFKIEEVIETTSSTKY